MAAAAPTAAAPGHAPLERAFPAAGLRAVPGRLPRRLRPAHPQRDNGNEQLREQPGCLVRTPAGAHPAGRTLPAREGRKFGLENAGGDNGQYVYSQYRETSARGRSTQKTSARETCARGARAKGTRMRRLRRCQDRRRSGSDDVVEKGVCIHRQPTGCIFYPCSSFWYQSLSLTLSHQSARARADPYFTTCCRSNIATLGIMHCMLVVKCTRIWSSCTKCLVDLVV